MEDERLPPLQEQLCAHVTKPHGRVRVVGLSGVGKSRLVLEALDRVEEVGGFLKDIVLYADESQVDPVAIKSVVQCWVDMGARVVVIVDRCPPESHEALVNMISRNESRLSLITIDNELPDGTPDKTTFRVGEAPAFRHRSRYQSSLARPAVRGPTPAHTFLEGFSRDRYPRWSGMG